MNDDFAIIETQVNQIASVRDAEAIIELQGKVDWIVARAKEIKRLFDLQLIEWIDEHGEFMVGDVRYYNGTKKTDKCNDLRATVEAIQQATGGDFDAFIDCLSSNAIKVGAARKALGDEKFKEMFTTTIEKDLKTGKPVRTVRHVETRFIESKAGTVPAGDDDEWF